MTDKLYELAGTESMLEMKIIFKHGWRIKVSLKSIEIFLTRYLEKKIDAFDIEAIFGILECECSELEVGQEEAISNIIFQVATPEINGIFDVEKCQELLDNIDRRPL